MGETVDLIRHAIDSTGRTARLCVILVVMAVAVVIPPAIMALTHDLAAPSTVSAHDWSR